MEYTWRHLSDLNFLGPWQNTLQKGDEVLARFWDERVKAEVEHRGKVHSIAKKHMRIKLNDGYIAWCPRVSDYGRCTEKRGVFPLNWEAMCAKRQKDMEE